MGNLTERARELRRTIEALAENLDDVAAAESVELFPVWSGDGVDYKAGDRVRYDGVLYKVLQNHTSQPGWNPVAAVSLFAEVLIPDPDVIPVWRQPDSTNPYMTGDKVHYPGEDDSVYESTIDNNVWSPADYPAGWRVAM